MSDIIHLLPDHIANQIAAGEVIQRPASAVKELLENAIDAGAQHIRLIVKEAGKSLIQVVDDGCGMSDTDARVSFERHATSKISTAEDLFCIRTMGFRGEAMASMAAIAHVELKTRRAEDEMGTRILIEGSEVKVQEPCQCTPGTSIAIKNLFYNVPARRNFLKSNSVETRHIIDEFQRVALANPELSFTMHHNGNETFHLKPSNLRQRIVALFGNNYNQRLVPAEEETDILKVYGFVGKPEAAKKTRGEQYFFVNNRFIKNHYLNHAVTSAYDGMLPDRSHPMYVLNIDIDPEHVDINVHPTKQEIKFDDERLVYAFIHAAVKHALAAYSITPSLDFDQETSFSNLEAFKRDPNKPRPSTGSSGSLPRFPGPSTTERDRSNLRNWDQLFASTPTETATETITVTSKASASPLFDEGEASEDKPKQSAQKIPYQLHNRYIITQIKSGFILIDQQTAHERILYEQYLAALDDQHLASQQILFPQQIELQPSDAALLQELLPEVNALGFDIREFGQQAFVVHGIPADLSDHNEQALVEGLIEHYKEHQRTLEIDKRDNLARALARNAAIKAGKPLQTDEMQTLIDQLFACASPYNGLSGRMTFITFAMEELERQFSQKPSNPRTV